MTRRCFFAAVLLMLVPAHGEPAQRVPVESSNLKSVSFDPKAKTLEIEFRHGGIYRYFEVPETIHAELMKSESKGGFFQKKVRGKFRFERISGGK